MDGNRILLIYNPVSGRSQIKSCLSDIIRVLSRAEYIVECYPTRSSGDARRYIRKLPREYRFILCAGGDGTLDEVVSGLTDNPALEGIPLGYIPLGTTNDFASGLRIPSDPVRAAQVVTDCSEYVCDLGRFNRRDYFTYIAAFGIFTETSYETPQELKNQLGHAAYVLQGLTELGNIRTYRIKAETESESIEDDFAFGMVTNARSVGGFDGIRGADVDLADGLFEATLIRLPANLLEINDLIQYFSGNIPETPLVWHRKVNRIVFSSDEKIRWTRDGENGGAHKRVTLENLPGKLRILVPRRDEDIALTDRRYGAQHEGFIL